MKKITIVLALLAVALGACGSSTSTAETPAGDSTSTSAPADTGAETPPATDSAAPAST